jgi:DNA methyltransferase 1-associated protein 1
MPTRENCAQLETLLEATTTLVELKKAVDRVEYEINVLKNRLGNRASEGEDTAQGDGGSGDVQMAEEAAEGGDAEMGVERAQSVVSTRSGRGRKPVGDLLSFHNTKLIHS